jgi:uncharacterized membrane protein
LTARIIVRFRRYLVAGLLIWLPLGATIVVFRLLLGLMDRLLFWLPAEYRPEALLPFPLPGLDAAVAVALAATLLLGTGMLAANLIGRRLVHAGEDFMGRIPLMRTVYGAVKKFAAVLFNDRGRSFKKVLLIQYPRKGVYRVALQTSEDVAELKAATGQSLLTAFIPTTPNAASGFIVFVPRNEVIELSMSVEDALKMIVSLGVVVPEWHPDIGAATFARDAAAVEESLTRDVPAPETKPRRMTP